jgi:ubiquinone biosynthesis protein Coq4
LRCQYGYPAFALIDMAVLALSFQRADGFQNALHLVGQEMRIGHECRPFIGIKWDESWSARVLCRG